MNWSDSKVTDSTKEKHASEECYKPVKSVGFIEAFSLIFGMMVGSGIFISVKPTFTVFESNTIGMVIVFWVLGGVLSLIGGLCYAELGTRIPESGGERAYYKYILGLGPAKSFVFSYLFIVKPIIIAATSTTASKYILSVIPGTENSYLNEKLLAIFILIMGYDINCASKTFSTKAGILFSTLKISSLIILISIGIKFMVTEPLEEWDAPFVLEGLSVANLTMCFINIFWSYEGWNTLGLVAGDMKNPTQDLPFAASSAIFSVVTLYVLANVSYSAVLGYEFVRSSTVVAGDLSRKTLKRAHILLPILIAFSAIGSVNVNLYTSGSVGMSAGFGGELLKLFSLVDKKERTPIICLTFVLIVTIGFMPLKFDDLLHYCAFVQWIFYFISFSCLVIAKVKKIKISNKNHFEVPMFCAFPMMLACLFVIGLSFYLKPVGCSLFLVIICCSFILFYAKSKIKAFDTINKMDSKLCHIFIVKLHMECANMSDIC